MPPVSANRCRLAPGHRIGQDPDLVNVIVSEFDPERVVLFGSVADRADGPDSDIDLLVVLCDAPLTDRRRIMVKLRRAARAIAAPLDLLVTSIRDFARNRTFQEDRVRTCPP